MTLEALRRRRPETLGELLDTYVRELQSVAYLILPDRAEAKDVVIENLLTAFERGGSIRDERALTGRAPTLCYNPPSVGL
jgi:DNA-directed RNA polymerase specialized sigma24 family protein